MKTIYNHQLPILRNTNFKKPLGINYQLFIIFEAVYEVESGKTIDNNRVAVIDLGLSTLATVSSYIQGF